MADLSKGKNWRDINRPSGYGALKSASAGLYVHSGHSKFNMWQTEGRGQSTTPGAMLLDWSAELTSNIHSWENRFKAWDNFHVNGGNSSDQKSIVWAKCFFYLEANITNGICKWAGLKSFTTFHYLHAWALKPANSILRQGLRNCLRLIDIFTLSWILNFSGFVTRLLSCDKTKTRVKTKKGSKIQSESW